jgi:hypothetical protein
MGGRGELAQNCLKSCALGLNWLPFRPKLAFVPNLARKASPLRPLGVSDPPYSTCASPPRTQRQAASGEIGEAWGEARGCPGGGGPDDRPRDTFIRPPRPLCTEQAPAE